MLRQYKVGLYLHNQIGYKTLEQILSQKKLKVSYVVLRKEESYIKEQIKNLCTKNDIDCFSPKNVNDFFLSEIEEVDYILSVHYNQILKKHIIESADKCYNLHFSLLPRLRGCFPTKWSIINGESTGITLHEIDEGIDTGDILFQKEMEYDESYTDAMLFESLCLLSDSMIDKTIDLMKSGRKQQGRKQGDLYNSYYNKNLPFKGCMDLKRGVDWCHRFARAFTFPGYEPAKIIVKTEESFLSYKAFYLSTICPIKTNEKLKAGRLIKSGDGFLIGCGNGSLYTRHLMDNETKKILTPKDVRWI